MSEQAEYNPYNETGGAQSSVVQVESSKLLPVIVVLSVLAGTAIALACFSLVRASDAELEARMLQYYLLELDAKVIAAGIKKPEDAISKKLKE